MKYMDKLNKSRKLYEMAKRVIPGGLHSNARWIDPHPIYFNKGEGSKIWDIDGNKYIDCMVNFGALILGHGDPDVNKAVKRGLKIGLTAAVDTELSFEVARKLKDISPCAEMVKFASTGTEAVMHAIMIARGYTKKERIIKAEGNYHGWYDYVNCSYKYPPEKWCDIPVPFPSSEGLCRDLLEKTLVIPWNDLESVDRIIKQYKNEIAAVIIEPVNHNIGCALPRKGYLEGVRRLTRENDILLIFDEVITGFRATPGGAQEFYGVTPDLTTYSKAIANGFTLSAVVGKKDIMEITDPSHKRVSFGGTFNGHQISLAAALVTLDKLKTGKIQVHLNRLTEWLIKDFNSIADNFGIKAKLQGFGGQFQVYFTDFEVTDYRTAYTTNRERYQEFRNGMIEGNILWSPDCFYHHGITASHSNKDIQKILTVAEKVLKGMKRKKV